MTLQAQPKGSPQNQSIKLPRLLRRYRESDFATQIKVRFIYYLYIVCISAVLANLAFTLYMRYFNNTPWPTIYPRIISEITAIVLIISSLYFLFKGYRSTSANLLLIILQTHIWVVLLTHDKELPIRFSAMSYLIALLSMIPIIMEKQRKTIVIYMTSNITMLGIMTFYLWDNLDLSKMSQLDLFFTNTIAIAFIGFVSYNIFIINQRSLLRAQKEIEERKEVEEALVASEKRYREMSDLLPQSIFEIKTDGTLLYVNKAGLKMFGYEEDDIKHGFNILSSITPNERDLVINNMQNFIETQKNTNNHYTALRKDGSTFPIQFTSSIIYNKDQITGIRGVGLDITNQKNAEESIKKSVQLFRTLIEFAPTPIFLSNDKGHFLMVNKAFCEQTGYTYEDITRDDGIRTATLIPEEYWYNIKQQLTNKGQVENLEIRTGGRSGEPIDILYYCKKIDIKGKTVYISTFIDITEKKKIEVELEFYSDQLEHLVIERTEELAVSIDELRISNENLTQQRAELEQALMELKNAQQQLMLADKMASLGLLAAGIAHEINNPLNFIKGGIYGLENFFHENLPNEKQEEAMPLIIAIDKGIDRAADIVKSLNRFSRQTEFTSELCDLHAIIEDCLILMDNQIKDRINIEKRYQANRHTFIYNQGRMNQAVLNLLTNATQAIDNQGKITIQTKNQKKTLTLSIQDDGCGIEQQHLNRIFDPFFTTKEPGKGTGLGLSITFQIIKEINGTIEYNSKPGEGTTVLVKIPLNTADNNE